MDWLSAAAIQAHKPWLSIALHRSTLKSKTFLNEGKIHWDYHSS
jgi:hypothetical protein